MKRRYNEQDVLSEHLFWLHAVHNFNPQHHDDLFYFNLTIIKPGGSQAGNTAVSAEL